MQKILLVFLAMLLTPTAFAQLNTFSEGDVISASQMNENFEYLEQQFRGARATTVDCDDGEKIGDAIGNGYTNITVSGTCNENLLFGVTNPSVGYSQKLAPRLLKLSGADSLSMIKDILANSEPLITIQGSTTLVIDNLILDGGNDGILAAGNSDLILNDVTIRNFSGRGIYITDSTNFDSYTDITIEGRGQGIGLSLCGGSFGVLSKATISNVDTGINLICNSGLWIGGFEISDVNTGIRVDNAKFNKFTENLGTISNVRGKGVEFTQSTGGFRELRIMDFNNTGSGWNPAIQISKGSSVDLNDVEIEGSTDGTLIGVEAGTTLGINNSKISGSVGDNLISASDGSNVDIRDSVISVNEGEMALHFWGNSRLEIRNSEISGSVDDSFIEIGSGSSAEIRDTILNITSAEGALRIPRNSGLRCSNTTITGTVSDNLVSISYGSSAEFRDSSLSALQSNGIYLSMGASLELGNTNLLASFKGIDANENSSVRVRSGSTITAQDGYAIKARRASGINMNIGAALRSTGGPALELDENSWATTDDGTNLIIDRTDEGPDIHIRLSSALTIARENTIGSIHCSGRSIVDVQENAGVGYLDPNCVEEP